MLLFGFGSTEIVLILLIALLFFGGTQVPKLARGLGESLRALKEGQNGGRDPSSEGK